MKDEIRTLAVLKNILQDEVFSALMESGESDEKFSHFVGAFYNRKKFLGAGINLEDYIYELVKSDVNAISETFAAKKKPPQKLTAAYLRDLKIISDFLKGIENREFFDLPDKKFKDAEKTYNSLKKIYSVYGCGKFINSYAFKFTENGLVPSSENSPSYRTIDELKDYSEQKAQIEGNLINFLHELPYADMLLYGDRGTGKSSTMHALCYAHFKDGLRLIEVDKKDVSRISELRYSLSSNPLKFIILLDDIALDGGTDETAELKTCIDGTSFTFTNSMIAATSNRRHIVRENFRERETAVNLNDVMQEQLALSERFGLAVYFPKADKETYLSIVKQLAADKKLKTDEVTLCELAERWALANGGRSPRRARQFVDYMQAAEIKGIDPDF